MRIRVAQASDRILTQLQNGSDVEIEFYTAGWDGSPSHCSVTSNGRQTGRHESWHMGYFGLWEVTTHEQQAIKKG